MGMERVEKNEEKRRLENEEVERCAKRDQEVVARLSSGKEVMERERVIRFQP